MLVALLKDRSIVVTVIILGVFVAIDTYIKNSLGRDPKDSNAKDIGPSEADDRAPVAEAGAVQSEAEAHEAINESVVAALEVETALTAEAERVTLTLPASSPLLPQTTANAGRSLTTTRDVARGEVVLSVVPDAWAPRWPCDPSALSAHELATCRVDSGAGSSFLPGIGREDGREAAVLSWLGGELQSLWLLGIRAALLSRSAPDAFASLLVLEDHLEDRSAAEERMLRAAGARLSRALEAGAGVRLAPTTLSSLLGVLLTNAFGLRALGEDGRGGLGHRKVDSHAAAHAISATAALFNHSCEPNCLTDFCLDGAGALSFRAAQPIAEGLEACISYVSTEEPTYVRRRELRRAKCFTCECRLCTDPCEGDRCGGFLRCTTCERGWQRWMAITAEAPPAAAADEAAAAADDWVCASCGTRTAHEVVLSWDEALRARLAQCVGPEAASSGGAAAGSERAATSTEATLRQLLAEAARRCHPNHALLLQMRLLLVAIAFNGGGEGTYEQMRRQLRAAQDALGAARRVLAAHDVQLADLLFQIGRLQHGLAQEALRPSHGTGQAPSGGAVGQKEHQKDVQAWLRGAAEAMLSAAAIFEIGLSADASPARAATQFAQLCIESLRKLTPGARRRAMGGAQECSVAATAVLREMR